MANVYYLILTLTGKLNSRELKSNNSSIKKSAKPASSKGLSIALFHTNINSKNQTRRVHTSLVTHIPVSVEIKIRMAKR